MSKDTLAYLEGNGVKYATTQDAAQALLKFVSDPSINGKYLNRLLGILLSSIGRAFGILPRGQVKSGYADLEMDDYKEGSDFMKTWDDEIAKNLARSQR